MTNEEKYKKQIDEGATLIFKGLTKVSDEVLSFLYATEDISKLSFALKVHVVALAMFFDHQTLTLSKISNVNQKIVVHDIYNIIMDAILLRKKKTDEPSKCH